MAIVQLSVENDAPSCAGCSAKSAARTETEPTARTTLGRSRRLTHDREYQAVYGAKMRKSAGPLTVFSVPNGRGHYRLGLAVGKRVGNAVMRTHLKRMLREAFRLLQHQLPRLASSGAVREEGLDVVIAGHAHPPTSLETYRQWLLEAVRASHAGWHKRRARSQVGEES